MPIFIIGIILAFVDPMLHGISTMIDTVSANHSFRSLRCAMVYGTVTSLPFLPLLFFFGTPSLSLSFFVWFLIFSLGLINFLYVFPFYRSLQLTDTSVVNALFSLASILVPVFAFFLVEEKLTANQYIGFILMLASSFFLCTKPKQIRPNQAFFLMLLVSSLLSLESVLYKLLLESVDWVTGFFWVNIVSILLNLSLLIFRQTRQDLRLDWSKNKRWFPIMSIQGFIEYTAECASTFAISVIPISIVKGISETQSFFVLLYGFIFQSTRYRGWVKKEDGQSIGRKIFLFLLLLIGTMLIIK